MKILVGILIALALIVVIAGVTAYAIGARLPVNHTASVTGTVEASPERVFAIITDVGAAPKWRKAVKTVQVLPPDAGRDHWVEDLGHKTRMNFLATRTVPPDAQQHALREVLLDVPGASYGGTWTYQIQPGPSPNQTILQITETGFIHPPIYRFMMTHLFGMTRNLDQYMHDLQAEARKS